jgi:hypothetical protein
MTVVTARRANEPSTWWVALAGIPLGFGVGPAFIYAAVRARARSYAIYGVVWLAVCLTGLVFTLVNPEDSSGDQFGSFLMVVTWFAGFGQAFAMRRSWQRRVRAHDADPILNARHRLERRDELRRLAESDPRLAREMGIGRGRVNVDDAGLVDVNHASQAVLAELPGVDAALAHRIAKARQEVHGFSSVEDLGTVLDLPPDVVEDMRDRAIFIARA